MPRQYAIAVTLLDDPNEEGELLTCYAEPQSCHNIRLERYDRGIICVADVHSDNVWILQAYGKMSRLPVDPRFLHQGSVSFTPVVLFRFNPHPDPPATTFSLLVPADPSK